MRTHTLVVSVERDADKTHRLASDDGDGHVKAASCATRRDRLLPTKN